MKKNGFIRKITLTIPALFSQRNKNSNPIKIQINHRTTTHDLSKTAESTFNLQAKLLFNIYLFIELSSYTQCLQLIKIKLQ